MKSIVYLVGAGPGDPQLITVKGLECLRKADVVVYDRLVGETLLDEARPEAEKIYVGKAASKHTLKQEEINRLLVAKAKEGKVVVRLKGGDPFVLGRGGEEAEALAENGISFEVVPGVTAAVAVPAYAGIPVTHRTLASSFAVITGHEDPGKSKSRLDWGKLANGADTLVFLMGSERLGEIVAQLTANGRAPSTPVALIRQGTTPQQQTITGTLADIIEKASDSNFAPPAIILVGKVVELRDKLRWFDSRPLFGKQILVTRARKQASVLSQLLRQLGAEPMEVPAIEITIPEDNPPLEKALNALERYHWIIFTSANGVEAFFHHLNKLGKDSRQLKGISICAIGPATEEALGKRGLRADLVPQDYTTEGILLSLMKESLSGKSFLLPRAEIANPELAQGLLRRGAKVEEIALYQTISPSQMLSQARQKLERGEIDIATFTSSSTVRNLVAMLSGKLDLLNKVEIACIGPVTAATAQELGLKVDIVAREHTIPGLVAAILEEHSQG